MSTELDSQSHAHHNIHDEHSVELSDKATDHEVDKIHEANEVKAGEEDSDCHKESYFPICYDFNGKDNSCHGDEHVLEHDSSNVGILCKVDVEERIGEDSRVWIPVVRICYVRAL